MPEKENVVAQWIRLLMCAVLAIYPFGLAAFYIWPSVAGSIWSDQTRLIDERHLIAVVAGTPILCIVLVWKLIPHKMDKVKMILCSILLFLIALSVRVFVSELMQTEPSSDFLTCYEYAANGSGAEKYLATYSYLGAYAVTLKSFFQVFGVSVFIAQLLNALAASGTSAVLFFAVSRITGKANLGAAAGLAYALCPSMIIYAAIPSCEHFSQLYFALSLCAFAFYCTAEWNSKKRWAACVMTGILTGCVLVYKQGLAMVIVPSILMAALCYECIPMCVSIVKERRITEQIKKKAMYVVAHSLLIILLAMMVNRLWIYHVHTELGAEPGNSGSLMVSIYEGLCMEGNGRWNEEVIQYVDQLLEEHAGDGEADRILYHKLIEQYKGNPQAFLQLLEQKYQADWCSEDHYYLTFAGDNTVVQGSWMGEVLFAIVPRIYFMLMCIVISVGLFIGMRKKEPFCQRYFMFYVTGVVFLFTLALILIEAQGRYKSNIMPLICILFAVCVDYLLDSVKRAIRFIFEKIFRRMQGEKNDQF